MQLFLGLIFLPLLTLAAPQPVGKQIRPATKSFNVQSEIEIDGQVVARPQFLTLPGRHSSLSDISDRRIARVELVAQDDLVPANSDAIMMKFKVALLHNGETKVHEPTVIARPNMPAELAIGNSNGRELFRLKVIAKREFE